MQEQGIRKKLVLKCNDTDFIPKSMIGQFSEQNSAQKSNNEQQILKNNQDLSQKHTLNISQSFQPKNYSQNSQNKEQKDYNKQDQKKEFYVKKDENQNKNDYQREYYVKKDENQNKNDYQREYYVQKDENQNKNDYQREYYVKKDENNNKNDQKNENYVKKDNYYNKNDKKQEQSGQYDKYQNKNYQKLDQSAQHDEYQKKEVYFKKDEQQYKNDNNKDNINQYQEQQNKNEYYSKKDEKQIKNDQNNFNKTDDNQNKKDQKQYQKNNDYLNKDYQKQEYAIKQHNYQKQNKNYDENQHKIYQKSDSYKQNYNNYNKNYDDYDQKYDDYDQQYDDYDQQYDDYDQKYDDHDKKYDDHDKKYDDQYQKYDYHNQKYDNQDLKQDNYKQKYDNYNQKYDNHNKKYDNYQQNNEKNLDQYEKKYDNYQQNKEKNLDKYEKKYDNYQQNNDKNKDKYEKKQDKYEKKYDNYQQNNDKNQDKYEKKQDNYLQSNDKKNHNQKYYERKDDYQDYKQQEYKQEGIYDQQYKENNQKKGNKSDYFKKDDKEKKWKQQNEQEYSEKPDEKKQLSQKQHNQFQEFKEKSYFDKIIEKEQQQIQSKQIQQSKSNDLQMQDQRKVELKLNSEAYQYDNQEDYDDDYYDDENYFSQPQEIVLQQYQNDLQQDVDIYISEESDDQIEYDYQENQQQNKNALKFTRKDGKDLQNPLTKETSKEKDQFALKSKPNEIKQFKLPQIDNQEYKVLMVAEKPSIAKSIAEALSGSEGFKSRKGISKVCQVHEFKGKFKGFNCKFKVTSVAGHVFSTDFPKQYQDWTRTNPFDLFDATTDKKIAMPKQHLIPHLQAEAKGCSFLFLWLDCDKEGENICFEVMDVARKTMIKENFQQVYRAKFSSLTKSDLKQAFLNLNDLPNHNESISVDARQIIDLKIGVAFSRYLTMFFQDRYKDLNNKLVTFGPCQTPTLGFCVQRMIDIDNFKPRALFRIVPTIQKNIQIEWDKDFTYHENEASKIKKEMEQINKLTVIDVISKKDKHPRPEGLNTVNLLKVASNNLGIGPQQAMHIAERLYLNGYTTYPRTESTSYANSFDFNSVIKSLCGYQTTTQYANQLKQQGITNPKKGVDAGDHPPITPTSTNASGLSGDDARLYNYIAQHFLASLSPDCTMQKQTVKFSCGQHQFKIHGMQIIEHGFTQIMPWITMQNTAIPDMRKGDVFDINQIEIRQGQTNPPELLSESELISLMEKNGIGTDASMATHINNICDREYVKVVGGRRLQPTDLGMNLVKGFIQIDNTLVAPILRSNIEKQCHMIAIGQRQYRDVLQEILEIFKQKFLDFQKNINKMDQFFGQTFGTVQDQITTSNYFTKCGHCKRLMKHVDKMYKLICETCNKSYDLPKVQSVKINGDKTCPLDGFQLVLCKLNQDGGEGQQRSFMICPNCYNNNPYADYFDEEFNLTCDQCPNIECQQKKFKRCKFQNTFSYENQKLGPCKECKEGLLILDAPTGVKHTATCNVCSNHLILIAKANVLKRLKKTCDKCQYHMLKFTLLKDKDQPNLVLEHTVCIFCDPIFSKKIIQQSLNLKEGTGKPTKNGRGRGRGRGRGKSRGGSNRGRGRGGPCD